MSLVLLDELGAGTDPTEGAALAISGLGEPEIMGSLHHSDHPLQRTEKIRPFPQRGLKTDPWNSTWLH